MIPTEEALAWIDIETDGLDPAKGNILEIAIFITDIDLNLLSEKRSYVVKYTYGQVAKMKLDCVERVLDMHTANGLWDELEKGEDLYVIEQAVSALLYDTAAENSIGQYYIAGNGVHFDLAWLGRHMPTVRRWLSYQLFDISTVSKVGRWWHKTIEPAKTYGHRAMDDIEESIKQAAFWREEMVGDPDSV